MRPNPPANPLRRFVPLNAPVVTAPKRAVGRFPCILGDRLDIVVKNSWIYVANHRVAGVFQPTKYVADVIIRTDRR